MKLKLKTGVAALAAVLVGWSNFPAYAAPDAASDAAATVAQLTALASGDQRSEANKARNIYRHPAETLSFFGLRNDMTVVELWPSAGWYTEILAPYLRDHGHYYAAGFGSGGTDYTARLNASFSEKLEARPDLYDRVTVTALAPPTEVTIAPPGSADMVLTFRNLHNWMMSGQLGAVLQAVHTALKPNGIFGVEEHRADPKQPLDAAAKSGYVNEDYIIGVIEAAGFKLDATSEINANPKDTKDYAGGVWTLPPTLREKDKDREKYLAIGESDRMTLRFRKVAP